MKLQAKINIRFLTLMVLIFSVSGVIFYYSLDRVVDQNIREMLESRKAYILLNLQKKPFLPDSLASPDNSIFVKSIGKNWVKAFYSDTLALDQAEKELVPFRKLTFAASTADGNYKVQILQSLLELDDLRMVIISFMGGLFLLVMISLFFVNRWLSAKAWNPFFRSLSVLNSWKFSESNTISFETTGIAEFDQLNVILANLAQKIRTDFENLKEFTENASHEIQTPLAIIKSKLEMILQDQSLDDNQHQTIQAAFESTIRLSKLNETLLLLSRIENQQFVGQEEIDIIQLIRSRIDHLKELFDLKGIMIMFQINDRVVFTMNPSLAEILINNLLGNALRHNVENGRIVVASDHKEISISNSGIDHEIDSARLFQRFAKNSAFRESNGLGLSIAQEICKLSRLKMTYHFSDELHHFVISSGKTP